MKVGSHGTCHSKTVEGNLTGINFCIKNVQPNFFQDHLEEWMCVCISYGKVRKFPRPFICILHLLIGACVATICTCKRPRLMYVQSVGADRREGDHAQRLVRGGLWGCSPSIFINQAFQGAVRGSIMRVITQAGCQSYYHWDPSLEITLTLLLVK